MKNTLLAKQNKELLYSGPSVKNYNFISNWLKFENEKIYIHSGKIDIGQHISTSLAIICSENLNVDLEKINILNLKSGVSPDEGFTAGSLSLSHSGSAIKAAAITFQNNFVDYICSNLNIKIDEFDIDNGVAKVFGTNQTFSYWEYADLQNFKSLKIDSIIPTSKFFKNKKISKVINKNISSIVQGEYQFVHDLDFPNMFHSRIVRPPQYSCKLNSIDKKTISNLKINGIDVVIDGSFIAVIGSDEFEVIKASNKVKNSCIWSYENLINADNIFNLLEENEKDTLLVKKGGGAFHEKIPEKKIYDKNSFQSLSSKFTKPYLMHGSIGPSAACSIFTNNKYIIFTHSQGIYQTRSAIAEALNIEEDNLELNFVPGSGCYGHNGADDVAYEAALIAKHIPNRHILLKWSREDEHLWEPYGSAALCNLSASLDSDGKIIYWSHETYADTFMTRPSKGGKDNLLSYKYTKNETSFKKAIPRTGDHMGIHRNLDPLYNFNNIRLVKNLVHNLPLRTSALRGLGAFGNVLAIESFMNELAEKADIEPIIFRLNHLSDDRAREVLIALNDQMQKSPLNENNSRGIGFARYKNSAAYCAVGIEIKLTDEVELKLVNAWISVDAGEVIYKDAVISQLEGGLIQGASWTIYEQVEYDTRSILSKDWDNYKIIGFDNIPNINVKIIERKGFPFLGVGEVVAGPVSAAIANALYETLGVRVRNLPFTKEKITEEILK
jgi:CO/xanthine dehydrogenase Mo-binding subunit